MCTKPGLVLVPQEDGTPGFIKELGEKVTATPAPTLLTQAIADRYLAAVKDREADARVVAHGGAADASGGAKVQASSSSRITRT